MKIKESLASTNKYKLNNIVALTIILTITVIGGLVALLMWKEWIGWIAVSIVCFSPLIFVLIYQKKQKIVYENYIKKYGEDPSCYKVDRCYFIHLNSHSNKIEIDVDSINKVMNIISYGTIEVPISIFDSEKVYPSSHIDNYISGQLNKTGYGAKIEMNIGLEDLIEDINRIIDKREVFINKLTKEQIVEFDTDFVKARRNDNINTFYNDTNTIYDILDKQGYRIIDIVHNGFCWTIVNEEEFNKIKELDHRNLIKQKESF